MLHEMLFPQGGNFDIWSYGYVPPTRIVLESQQSLNVGFRIQIFH